jgi:chitin disaccharide deacetylase
VLSYAASPVQIVVNADDFGYSQDTVEATVAALETGLLTGATIMANMPATAEALAYASRRPDLSFGVHLAFVGDGSEAPVSRVSEVPALVTADGCFPGSRDVRARALAGRLPVDQIEYEVAAQLDVLVRAGIEISHVDSHRHLHKFKPFRTALRHVLPRYGIRRVRTVQDVYVKRPLTSLTYWLGPVWRTSLTRYFDTTDHFYMPTTAGDRGWERVASQLASLDGATLEVGLHPGREDVWRRHELESLEPFVSLALGQGHELVGWRTINMR